MQTKEAKIIIATHYLVYGPSQALREYLIDIRNKKLLFISHPLSYFNHQDRSYFELSERGLLKIRKSTKLRAKNLAISCFWELWLTLKWAVCCKKKYDLFVGVDNWNALAGLILKKLGIVKKAVYYVIDYFPTRFENKLLNWVYFQVDKFCVKYADETWNLSPNMAYARENKHNMSRKKYNKQKVVPVGVWFDSVVRNDFSEVKKHQMVFVGHLLEMMGVQLVIRAIPLIIKKISDFHFLIIGGGEYEIKLKELVKQLSVDAFVSFTGWIRDRKKRDKLLAESACGAATFNTEILDEKVRNADPAKIKDYLVLGLPVILTDAPLNAYDLEKNGCGIVVSYQIDDLAKAVISLMSDENKLARYRANALQYVKQYNWPVIFDYNLKRVLNNL